MRTVTVIANALLLLIASAVCTFAGEIRVVEGVVQPARPVHEAVTAAMSFLARSDGPYLPGRTDVAAAEPDQLAGYFLSARVHEDGTRTGPDVCYPARHHAYFILTFLHYFGYTGRREWLVRAQDLANWNLAHSTPADGAFPHLPWSTYNKGAPGGGDDRNSIEPDKAGFLGSAYLALFDATADERYLAAAVRIADVLCRMQRDDGSWAFRVVPQTGEVLQEFGGAPVLVVEFFERLLGHRPESRYTAAHEKALDYMIRTNARQNLWGTYHEDVGPMDKTYLSAEPMTFTADYLLCRADRNREYVELARRILDPVEQRFVHRDGHPVAPAPAVAEQPGCNYIMPGHTARYCAALAQLYRLTGDETERRAALSGLNALTHMQTQTGLFRTWIWDVNRKRESSGLDWYSQHLYAVYHLLQAMERLPEIAPDRQTHLLSSDVPVREIVYGTGSVRFVTARPSSAVLKLDFVPAKITHDGKPLDRTDKRTLSGPAWSFDPAAHTCHVRHPAGRVEISTR